jgi:hypothetical protein
MSEADCKPAVVRKPWPVPSNPSPQLKVVLEYFDCLGKWDLETLAQLSTSYFYQVTLPASMNIPYKTKKEDIEFLHKLRDSLKGAPLEVCNRMMMPSSSFRRADQNPLWKERSSYTMSTRPQGKFGSM